MWKQLLIFFVIIPGAFITGLWCFWRRYKKYPTGAVAVAREKRKEWERVREARKELRRIENGQ